MVSCAGLGMLLRQALTRRASVFSTKRFLHRCHSYAWICYSTIGWLLGRIDKFASCQSCTVTALKARHLVKALSGLVCRRLWIALSQSDIGGVKPCKASS
jgi:hypothetical protein